MKQLFETVGYIETLSSIGILIAVAVGLAFALVEVIKRLLLTSKQLTTELEYQRDNLQSEVKELKSKNKSLEQEKNSLVNYTIKREEQQYSLLQSFAQRK